MAISTRIMMLSAMTLLGGCAASATNFPPGLHVSSGEVHVDGRVSMTEGWLEQVACVQGTRDHEVLITTQVQPSLVHAALLLAGAQSGAPGGWTWASDALHLTPPSGDVIDVLVSVDGRSAEPVSDWIKGEAGESFPDTPWLFAGSAFLPGRNGGETYAADQSGSLVGLVTFGDEVVAWREVLSDQVGVQPPLWQAHGAHMPPPGTPVTLVLRPRR
ncbi:MAG: YdjY domain-containing protein [Phycisphaerales bacterium]|nr:YdjY domain-containing protein [Phycisphaerales bacterium]